MLFKMITVILTVLIVSVCACGSETENGDSNLVSDETELPSEYATVAEKPDMVFASHILLAYEGAERGTATRTKEEALELIESLQDSISAGSLTFSEAAMSHSDCPSSSDGGDLGSFPRNVMDPAFEEAAFGLDPGEISDIVETPFGYHLIMRTE
jgi:parvulin-like peptidyl-prolyl isomerase